MFQNSVNLFTGEVAFSLPLVNLPGRGGLNAGVGIAYSSAGVRQQVETWNLEAPTGILGLGWRLDIPKVVVDHKSTGTRTDDDYYLVEGGVSNPLVVTKKENGIRHFASTNYKFWDIQYRENGEIWTIIKEDGTTFIYGNRNSDRQTVQYLVKWGNWMGSSSESSGQAQQAMQWDLSEIRNIYGDAVTFTYEQTLQKVGSPAGKEHTEASYLTEIKNPQGQVITLVYADKDDGLKTGNVEYQEPHTEAPEPDAYQERYEKKFLNAIEVRHLADEEPRYQIKLGYVLSGSGDFTKRLLTSIQKTDASGNSLLSPIEFAYKPTGKQKGAIEVVTTSQGPQVEYTYGSVVVDGSERDFTIDAPDGYSEPQTWIGNDYVVVAWRQLNNDGVNHEGGKRTVKLKVYQWAGRWIEGSDLELTGIELQEKAYKNLKVTTSQSFFAVQSNERLFLCHQDSKQVGAWLTYSTTFEDGNHTSRLLVGDNFAAVGGHRLTNSETSAWVWNGTTWVKENFELPPGDYAYTSGGNYIIAHDNDLVPGEIIFLYLDELQRWQRGTVPHAIKFTSGHDGNGPGDSYWYGSSTFAVCMADAHPEFIFHWDENYFLTRVDDKLMGWDDQHSVTIRNNSLIGIGIGTSIQPGLFRYNGKEWVSKFFSNGDYNIHSSVKSTTALGTDFFLRGKLIDTNPNKYETYFELFNPNINQWDTQTGEQIESIWFTAQAGTSYSYTTGTHFYREPSGYWTTLPAFTNSFAGIEKDPQWQHGGRISAYKTSEGINVHVSRNKYAIDLYALPGKRISKKALNFSPSNLIGSNILITFPVSDIRWHDAKSLTLHKLVDRSLTGQQTAYPVTRVTVHNGYQELPTTYAYTASSATMSPAGYTAQFNEVKTILGNSQAEATPYGYTVQYFFNGLSDSHERVKAFPSNAIEANGARKYIGKLLGMSYTTEAYDQTNKLVASSQTAWRVYSRDIKVGGDALKVSTGYLANVEKSTSQQDGFYQSAAYEYDLSNGLVYQATTTNGQGKPQVTRSFHPSSYRYQDSEKLGSHLLRDRHILTPVLAQEVSVDGVVLQKSETHYALQDATQTDSAPVPVKTVVYPNGEDESYSITSTYQYDRYGNLLQSQAEGGLISSYLYGYDYTRPVAEAIEATYAELKAQLDPATIQDKDGNALRQALDGLRSGLPKAHIATTTYDSFYGNVLSVTDPRERTTYSTYDQLGRLQVVKDHDGYVRQKVEYSLQK